MPRLSIRLAIDLTAMLLLLFALAYRIIGDVPHEWIGVAVILLLSVVHNGIGWRWYRGLFKGKYDSRRILNTLVNFLLLLTLVTLVISGILLSRTVFAFLGFNGGMGVRQIHSFAAYWGLIVIAVHVGMHWEMIMSAARRMAKITEASRIRTSVLRIVTALIVAYGIYASFDRQMGAKLFLGYSFDFWDPDRPAVLFFTSNLAIMGLYVCVTHALKLLAYRRPMSGRHGGGNKRCENSRSRPGRQFDGPSSVKHGHGALPAMTMTNLAPAESLPDGGSVEWMEEIANEYE